HLAYTEMGDRAALAADQCAGLGDDLIGLFVGELHKAVAIGVGGNLFHALGIDLQCDVSFTHDVQRVVFEGVGGTGGMHGLGDYDAAVTAVVARTADHHARLIGLTCSRARDAVLLDYVAVLLKAISLSQRGGGVV